MGFYSDGFCSGHCEHAPMRIANPELNSMIEAWHDKYYNYPTEPLAYLDELDSIDPTSSMDPNDTSWAALRSTVELVTILSGKLVTTNDYDNLFSNNPF
jgi:hypothetical protein